MLARPAVRQPAAALRARRRNDQLETAVRSRPTVRRLASRRERDDPGGHAPSDAAQVVHPTRLCSHFPHVYDGIVYLYDCEDTLTWDGSVTLTRIR